MQVYIKVALVVLAEVVLVAEATLVMVHLDKQTVEAAPVVLVVLVLEVLEVLELLY